MCSVNALTRNPVHKSQWIRILLCTPVRRLFVRSSWKEWIASIWNTNVEYQIWNFCYILFILLIFMHFMFCNILLSGYVSILSFLYSLIIHCCSFFIFWFHSFFFLFFLVCKEDWGILFRKILAKCHSKKDRNLFCFAWNFFNTPWRSSIISSLRFTSSFILVYFGLNFVHFCLLVILFEGISL